MIGELINGRYRIECEAGSGGMADVYKAHDLKTNRTVALKVIKKDYCRDPKYVRRFEREAQAVLSLKNANIVRAYDYGTYDSRSFIVMEFVKGCKGCRCNNKNVRREKRCGFGPLYFPGTSEGRGSRNGKRYIFRGNNAF